MIVGKGPERGFESKKDRCQCSVWLSQLVDGACQAASFPYKSVDSLFTWICFCGDSEMPPFSLSTKKLLLSSCSQCSRETYHVSPKGRKGQAMEDGFHAIIATIATILFSI